MIGLLNFFICSSKIKLSLSPDEILKAGTKFFRKFALLISNGVDKKIIYFLSQYFLILIKSLLLS